MAYCNAHSDLKTAFCGGQPCDSSNTAQVESCRTHWKDTGQGESTRTDNPVTCTGIDGITGVSAGISSVTDSYKTFTTWTPSTALVSGRYSLFASAQAITNDVAKTKYSVNGTSHSFWLRATQPYSVDVVFKPALCSGCVLLIDISGDLGDTSTSSETYRTISVSSSATATKTFLFVGTILSISLSATTSTGGTPTLSFSSIVIKSAFTEDAVFGGESQAVGAAESQLSNCALVASCAECGSESGCSWCGSTRTCQASIVEGGVAVPSVGTCSVSLTADPGTCPDPCAASKTCQLCASSGCGWCGTSCLSLSKTCSSGTFTTTPETCPVPTSCVAGGTWSSSGKPPCAPCAAPSTCALGIKTACAVSADTECVAPPFNAHAGSDQVVAAGTTTAQLDGSKSTPCIKCGTAACSGHGSCTETSVDVTCACSGGYSGAGCGTVPDACYQQTCSGHGTCSLSSGSSGGFSCLCSGGYTGGTCNVSPGLCYGKTCSGKGSCVGGDCSCEGGYFGTVCSGVCPGAPAAVCTGHGTCADGASGNGACKSLCTVLCSGHLI